MRGLTLPAWLPLPVTLPFQANHLARVGRLAWASAQTPNAYSIVCRPHENVNYLYRYPMNRPFCTLPPDRIVKENDLAMLTHDAYPVSPGHSLVIPKRHIGSWFEATIEERNAMLALLDDAKVLLDAAYSPDSYNIGINDGPAAGPRRFSFRGQ